MATAEEVEREWDEKLAKYSFSLEEKRELCADVLNYRIRQDSGDWYVGSLAMVRVASVLGIKYGEGGVNKAISKASDKVIEKLYDYLKYYIIVMIEHRGRKRVVDGQVIFWPNGNTSFTVDGEQESKLQVSWLALYFEFLEDKGVDPTKQKYQIAQHGRIFKVFPFKTDNGWNWRVEESKII